MMRALGLMCGLGCAVTALALDPAVTPDALKAAEKTFREIYGKEYDRVMKSKNVTEKLTLGKKIWDVAKGTARDPAIVSVFGDKALPLLMSHADGYTPALEIRTRTVEPPGKARLAQLLTLNEIYDKKFKANGEDVYSLYCHIEAQRDLADQYFRLRRDSDCTTALTKARDAVKPLTGYRGAYTADHANLSSVIASDRAYYESVRRHLQESMAAKNLIKANPEDARSQVAMARMLIRMGRLSEAIPYLKASQNDVLTRLVETIGQRSPEPLDYGDRWRAAGEAFATDKPWFHGIARMHYETASAGVESVAAVRARSLAKELPLFRRATDAAPTPNLTIEVVDEGEKQQAALAAFHKSGSTGVSIIPDAYAGLSALRLPPGNHVAECISTDCRLDSWRVGHGRYFSFAVLQKGGTYLRVSLMDPLKPINVYSFGKSSEGISLHSEPPRQWQYVVRDLYPDHVAPFKNQHSVYLKALRIESDGEVWLDSVYVSPSRGDLERLARSGETLLLP